MPGEQHLRLLGQGAGFRDDFDCLPLLPTTPCRKDLSSVTMVIMEWLWKSIRFSQFLCKRVNAIRWTFIPINPSLGRQPSQIEATPNYACIYVLHVHGQLWVQLGLPMAMVAMDRRKACPSGH